MKTLYFLQAHADISAPDALCNIGSIIGPAGQGTEIQRVWDCFRMSQQSVSDFLRALELSLNGFDASPINGLTALHTMPSVKLQLSGERE